MAKAPPVAPNAPSVPVAPVAANGTTPVATVAQLESVAANLAAPVDPNAPTAPVAPAGIETAGAPAEKAKRGRAALPRHPSLWDSAADGGKGKALKIDAIPADYDDRKFAPLREADFNDTGTFFEYQATVYDKKAHKMRELAKQSRTIGAMVSRKEANKLTKLQSKLMEMVESLVKAQPPEKQESFRVDIMAQMLAQKESAKGTEPAAPVAPAA